MKRVSMLSAMIFAVAQTAAAQEHVHPAGDAEKIGRVTLPTSCSAAAQPQFERAVAMLHSFWFEAADEAFTQVTRTDPTCAMAFWGRAMTMLANPMTRISPSADALRLGKQYAEQAHALVARASHREQMYVDAVMAYYRDYETRDHLARMASLERGFDALRKAHPEDMEATIFFARTLVANASPADTTFRMQIEAAELLEPHFARHPDHPGLAHYIIHAYDAPPIANRGAKAAEAYADIAPAAPHALHMPSHIFTRLGRWQESIETNARSARAEPDSNAAVHPMDYMVYAFLQQGRERDAKHVVDRAKQNPDRFYGGILGYNFAAMPARFALEREAWAEAAALREPPASAPPFVRALTHFARAVAAARSGNTAQARRDVDTLAAITAALEARNDSYWATVTDAQRLAASAWIAYADKDVATAARLARQAAEVEERVEKHPVTPGPMLPARELEGDLLMKIGRYADAQAAYEKTLVREPRRARALFGAARAAEKAGNKAVATQRYEELLEVMAKADPDREEPRIARRFLAQR